MKNSGSIAGFWLHFLGLAGLVLSLILFCLYIFGLLPVAITPAESAEAWSLPLSDYMNTTGSDSESLWMFAGIEGYGMSTAALAILASASLPVLLILALYWLRRKDRIYAIMAVAISAVISVAILS